MHWIERSVLEYLIYHASARNSELRPDGVESNLFQYHLKKLVKASLIEKLDNGRYTLGPEGLYWADRFSGKLHADRPQTKVMTAVILTNKNRGVLLLKRTRQPFIGSYIVPSGKVHLGELWHEAAHREVQEKVGISVSRLAAAGSFHMVAFSGERTMLDHTLFVFTAPLPEQFSLPQTCAYFESGMNLAPGHAELIASFRDGKANDEIRINL